MHNHRPATLRFPLMNPQGLSRSETSWYALNWIISILTLTVMVYEASLREIHIWGGINKQCVLWRMSRLCLGIINPAVGGEKVIVFFVVLFFSSTYVFFQLIGTLIKVWSLRMNCKHGLMISSRLCNWVWMQSELYERSMIYVVVGFISYLTNPGLNLPAGVWTLLFFCICRAPQFHDPRPTSRSSCGISNGPIWGNENQSPQETPIFPLTEHVLIYFLLKLRMCGIAVIVEEGACGLLWFIWILMWFNWQPEVRQIPHFYLFCIVWTCTEHWTWFFDFKWGWMLFSWNKSLCLHST